MIARPGTRVAGASGGRKVRTPQGRALGNTQAEQSDTGATESIPPMAHAVIRRGSGKGEKAG
jgi:hypothetical protein